MMFKLLPALAALSLVATNAYAEIPMAQAVHTNAKIHFQPNSELSEMLASYSKATGQKIIIDPGVRGKVTTLIPGEVSSEEAFNIICDSLAINGFTLVAQGDTLVVKSARNAQRDMVPTLTELPSSRPNLMVNYIVKLKYISAEEVNKRLRILPSKDGEMTPFEPSNSIIIGDFTPNIVRIAEIIAKLDTPDAANWKDPHPRPPTQPTFTRLPDEPKK